MAGFDVVYEIFSNPHSLGDSFYLRQTGMQIASIDGMVGVRTPPWLLLIGGFSFLCHSCDCFMLTRLPLFLSLDRNATSKHQSQVVEVYERSTSEEAGLKAGDVIVEVDGRDVLNASHEKVIQLLKSPNEFITLSVVPLDHQMLVDVVRIMEKQYADALGTKPEAVVRKNSKKSGKLAYAPSTPTPHTTTAATTPAARPPPQTATNQANPASLPPPPGSSTDGWHVLKEGLLVRTKKASGFFKSIKTRRYVLKVQPLTLTPELEYYAPTGSRLLGSLNCSGATVKPGFGAGFTIHAAVEERSWVLAAEGGDVRESVAWMKVRGGAHPPTLTIHQNAVLTEQRCKAEAPKSVFFGAFVFFFRPAWCACLSWLRVHDMNADHDVKTPYTFVWLASPLSKGNKKRSAPKEAARHRWSYRHHHPGVDTGGSRLV